jgi:hypothetical protein
MQKEYSLRRLRDVSHAFQPVDGFRKVSSDFLALLTQISLSEPMHEHMYRYVVICS